LGKAAVIYVIEMVAAASLLAQAPPPEPSSSIFRQPPVVTGPTPHQPDGTPDLSGVWMGGGSNSGDITKALKAGDSVVMTPGAEKLFKAREAKDDPEANCLPFGIPRSAPYP